MRIQFDYLTSNLESFSNLLYEYILHNYILAFGKLRVFFKFLI